MKRVLLTLVTLMTFSAGFAQLVAIDNEMSKVMKKANKGDVDAMYRISMAFYNKRIRTNERMKMFYTWTKKAAEAGHAEAMGNLGTLYSEGVEEANVAADAVEALKWYRKGAEAGSAFAMYNYGASLHDGRGCDTNLAEGFRWMKKAYDSNDSEIRDDAQYALAFCYINGEGVEQNYAEGEGFRLMKGVAEKGENVRAINMVGSLYYYGRGTTQNYTEAFKWYREAADHDFPNALRMVGQCYQNGQGVQKDIHEAAEWYERAVEKDNPYAAEALGEMYYKGEGVTKDYDKAFTLLKMAAESGNHLGKAMRLLSACYRYGLGTAQDEAKDKYWLEKAAQYDDEAKKMLESK